MCLRLLQVYGSPGKQSVLQHLRLIAVDEVDECLKREPEAMMLLMAAASRCGLPPASWGALPSWGGAMVLLPPGVFQAAGQTAAEPSCSCTCWPPPLSSNPLLLLATNTTTRTSLLLLLPCGPLPRPPSPLPQVLR